METQSVQDRHLGEFDFPLEDKVMAPAIQASGEWEPAEIAWLKKNVKPGSRCLNVGANVGYFSAWMSKLAGPKGHVAAVEANPALAQLLTSNLQRHARGTVETFFFAAGSESGEINLYPNKANFGDSRVFDPRLTSYGGTFLQHGFDESVKPEKVPIRVLDEVFASEDFDVILIDTQGWDHEVIKGLKNLVIRCKPVILTEFVPGWISDLGSSPIEVLEYYQGLGYSIGAPEIGLAKKAKPEEILEALSNSTSWFTNLQLTPKYPPTKIIQHLRNSKPLLHPISLWRRHLGLEASHREALEQIENLQELIGRMNIETEIQVNKNNQLENELRAQSLFRIRGPRELTPSDQRDVDKLIQLWKIRTCNFDLARVGSQGDGGYLIPKLDTEYDLVISGGIESNIDFEIELVKAGALVRAADYSIPKFPIEHPNVQFFKQYVSDISSKGKLVSLNDLIGPSLDQAKNPLLKLDIEGSEWLALRSINQEALSKFSTLVIEFHWLENAENAQALSTITEVFSKISMAFDLVHVHPNNNAPSFMLYNYEFPSVFEATFLNKSLNGQRPAAKKLSSNLDVDNNPNAKSVELSNFWFE